MKPSHSTRKRRGESWSEDTIKAAIKAVQRGHLTQRSAATKYNIPRRTLRDHLKTGQEIKRLGKKPILTNEQEKDLASRIKKFASIGIPLTPKFIRKKAFLFCERYDIKNNFNKSKRIAGVDWLRFFLNRNPSISKRKPQIMNPARAQKLNKPIVQQHFQSIRKLYDELDILRHPERLYNMDEKGCRITVHKQHTVLAEKGSERVHLIAPEHAENVTIAMCVNAIVNPDRTLKKADFNKIFSQVWPKCMTHTNIVNGFKATGLYPYNPEAIPEEAFAPSVLSEIPYPQNQNKPMQNPKSDANVDTDSDENQRNLDINTSNILDLTPDEFNVINIDDNLTVTPRTEQCDNLQIFLPQPTALKAQNISRIVDYSSSTDISENELENPTLQDSFHNLCVSPSKIPENFSVLPEVPANKESSTGNDIDMAVPSCSGLQRHIRRTYSSASSDIDSFIIKPSHDKLKYSVEDVYGCSSDEENEILSIIDKGVTTPKKQIINVAQENINQKANPDDDKSCFSDEENVPLSNLKKPSNKTEFEDFLPTPNYAITKTNRPRKKALNYKGQRITKDLFDKKDEDKKKTKNTNTKEHEKNKKDKIKLKNKSIKTKDRLPKKVKYIANEQENKKRINEKKDDTEEHWYCYACHENIKLDMRQCKFCKKWYHEECVGLTKHDEDFMCSNCE
ncbi:unnamed protein product [Arctia plantaginis]|uniref:HTH CENPB-type domain-containing protein n=1 Tax=Arctia plantaginis TaxID=874455 RepID=A0A8S0ZZT1_ARCPL|nr:unnamed protein product [Arctia plantaginis]